MSRHHRQLNQKRWRGLRKSILNAAGWRCACCQRYGNEVDHRIPLHLGGSAWDKANLQVLCSRHHIAKTRKENERQVDPDVLVWRARVAEMLAE